MFRKLALLSAVALGIGGGVASAQEAPKRFYIHVGPADVIFDEGAKLYAGGQLLPGATISLKDRLTVAAEVGYFITPNFAVSFTGGYPLTSRVQAAGSLQGDGEIAKAVYGPTALTVHYHYNGFGRFRPYIGGGAVYMIVLSTKDALLTNVNVDNHFGYLGQVGADYLINDKWGAFVDFKKSHLYTHSSGNLGAAPVTGDIKMNPSVVMGGVSYRF